VFALTQLREQVEALLLAQDACVIHLVSRSRVKGVDESEESLPLFWLQVEELKPELVSMYPSHSGQVNLHRWIAIREMDDHGQEFSTLKALVALHPTS